MSRRVAVVGSGVSGLTTAYLLQRASAQTGDEVTLFEADERLGGHSHTHDVTQPDGTRVHVDSGFIVHNHRTYPNLLRLFDELDVETQPTEMSMSIRCEGCGLEYAGGRGAGGILAQPRNAVRPRFVRMLLQVKRFHRLASQFLEDAPEDDLTPFGAWLDERAFDPYFVAHFALPLVACVWSSGHDTALEYPARYLFTFLDHHGMLTVTGSPQWYTMTNGSARYVEKIAATLPDVRVGTRVVSIERDEGVKGSEADPDTTRDASVVLRLDAGDGSVTDARFDHVVIATHGPTALKLLAEPTDAEREILGAFTTTANRTALHRDASVLPRNTAAQASWNYRMSSCEAREQSPSVTYWMNRLHSLDESAPLLVTLDEQLEIPDADVIAQMSYEHPRYTPESVAAAGRIDEICDEHVSYAGAHLAWGFHEDGCRSGVRAAERLGVSW